MFTQYDHSFQWGGDSSALLWVSNLYFLLQGRNYFGAENIKNLYLHTWSLGVEEQFYLIWPLIVALAIGGKRGAKRFIGLILLVSVFSFLACLFFSKVQTQFVFYQMPTRIWQFALGGLLAYSQLVGLFLPGKKIIKHCLPLIGLGCIVFRSVIYADKTAYPNWQVLIPTFGALFILMNPYVHGGGGVGNRLLSNPVLVWIGDMPYSIYLWHWPVLFFGAYMGGFFVVGGVFLSLAITMLISSISYYWIEQPIRHNNWLKGASMWVAIFAGASITLALLIVFYLTSVSETKFDKTTSGAMVRKQSSLYELGCDDWFSSSDLKPCFFGNRSKPSKVVVLIGDSILAQWFPAINEHSEKNGWMLIAITKSSCPMVSRSIFYERINRMYTECDDWRSAALKYIAEIKPDLVIFGSFSGYSFSDKEWLDGTKDVLDALAPNAEKIKIILGTPSLGFDPASCLSDSSGKQSCSTLEVESDSWRWIYEAAENYGNVDAINLSTVVCPEGICNAKLNNTVVFRDPKHLTVDFVLSVRERVMQMILGEQ